LNSELSEDNDNTDYCLLMFLAFKWLNDAFKCGDVKMFAVFSVNWNWNWKSKTEITLEHITLSFHPNQHW